MTAPLQTTFEVLSTSRNDAAVPVLISALQSEENAIYQSALKALVARRNRAGHFALVSRWHELSEEHRELVREGRGKMSAALRDGILSDDGQTFNNSCELVEEFGEFDLISTLITLAENKTHKHSSHATILVTRLANRLSEMVHGHRDKRDRRNPSIIRRRILESLEQSVQRFRTHNRSELIEAFVVLGGSSSGLLRAIIEDPRHACYLTVIHALSTSDGSAVVELLLGFLKSDHVSQASLTIISKRSDKAFVEQLLQFVGNDPPRKLKRNLARIRSFAWLQAVDWNIEQLDEADQERCAVLLSASGLEQDQLLETLERLLKQGQPLGRVAACQALTTLKGDGPGRLVREALADPDPGVQAAATRQLREHRVTDSLGLLLKLVDSPHKLVRDAACESLDEFSLENYLKQFDELKEDTRQSNGKLVAKIDQDFVGKLSAELESPSRKNRLRAIEVAEATGMVKPMSEALIDRLADKDHLVRAAAADVLQLCPTAEVQQALRQATLDRSPAVQNAARIALAAFAGLKLPIDATGALES